MSSERPNFLLLLSDQHSFRYLGHRESENGGEPVRTPTFDELAASGVSFERTYCAMPLCTPSRLCLLTGRNVRNAGAWGNWSVLRPDLDTLPMTLSNAGYETCHLGKMHIGGNRQYAGFDHRPYGDLTGGAGHQFEPPGTELYEWDPRSFVTDVGVTDIPESLLQEHNIARETLAFLREHRHRNPDQPWFLCASFSRPHWPRTAPRRFVERYWPEGVTPPPVGHEGDSATHPLSEFARERFDLEGLTDEEIMKARAAYFACVEFLDEIIGDLIASLNRDGFLDNTVVIYTSDHGENAGEHGLWDKRVWTDASTRVPLFIETPEHRSGDVETATVSIPVSLIDLYPTICDVADVDPPADLDGTNLSKAVYSGADPDRGPVFIDHLDAVADDRFRYRAVVDGAYKYVGFTGAPDLLFDLDADPLERINLAPDGEGRDADALERLEAVARESMDFEAAVQARRQDESLHEDYPLRVPKGTGNAYQLGDGRIVDADTPLYHPHVLVEHPAVVFDDYPAGN